MFEIVVEPLDGPDFIYKGDIKDRAEAEQAWEIAKDEFNGVCRKVWIREWREPQDKSRICKYILRRRELERMRLSVAYRDRIKEKERKWRIVKRKMGV